MKRIINGRLYDTDNMIEVGTRQFKTIDPNLGADVSYNETLYREVALRPGETVDTAYVKDAYSYRWEDGKIDKRRGGFVLLRCRGWSDDPTLTPVSDADARAWFERHHGGECDRYAEFFGEPETQFPGSREAATVRELESTVSSQRWSLGRKDEEIKAKDAEIAALKAKLDAVEAGL